LYQNKANFLKRAILKKKYFNMRENFLDSKIKKIYYSQRNLGKVYFLIKKFLLKKMRIL